MVLLTGWRALAVQTCWRELDDQHEDRQENGLSVVRTGKAHGSAFLIRCLFMHQEPVLAQLSGDVGKVLANSVERGV